MINPLRNLPSVNDLLESPPLKSLSETVNRNTVVTGVRSFLDRVRGNVQAAAGDLRAPSPAELAESIARWIIADEQPALRPAINATGVLLHTNLGRAPLADEAIAAIAQVARGYATVELDTESGKRSSRAQAVERMLKQLTGAEAATVVNNNAAATLLALSALAGGKEVIVSRGELVEIGGSYRLPEVMSQSGAHLCEVGTTNKTRAEDYRAAISDSTAALMHVHCSNYQIVGFTEQPTLGELVAAAHAKGKLLIDDIGSGALQDLSGYGVTGEPKVSDSIKAGSDVVLFSGDKLLGGPQCGIIVGKQSLIDKINKHPLMRAVRCDKITLAALAATLDLHRNFETAKNSLPLYRLLDTPLENLHNRAVRMATQIAAASMIESATPQEGTAQLGGGSTPGQTIPTWCVAVEPKDISVDRLSAQLRRNEPPIISRISEDRLLIDLRTIFPQQDIQVVDAFHALSGDEPINREPIPPEDRIENEAE